MMQPDPDAVSFIADHPSFRGRRATFAPCRHMNTAAGAFHRSAPPFFESLHRFGVPSLAGSEPRSVQCINLGAKPTEQIGAAA